MERVPPFGGLASDAGASCADVPDAAISKLPASAMPQATAEGEPRRHVTDGRLIMVRRTSLLQASVWQARPYRTRWQAALAKRRAVRSADHRLCQRSANRYGRRLARRRRGACRNERARQRETPIDSLLGQIHVAGSRDRAP